MRADLNLNLNLKLDPEYPVEPLSPGHGRTRFAGRLVLRLIRCFGVAAFASLRRRYLHAMLAVGGEHTMEAGKVDSWFGHQGGRLVEEFLITSQPLG